MPRSPRSRARFRAWGVALAAGVVLSPYTQMVGLRTLTGPGGVECGSVVFAPQPGTGTPAECDRVRREARERTAPLVALNLALVAGPAAYGAASFALAHRRGRPRKPPHPLH